MAGKRKTVLDKAYLKAAYTSGRKRADEQLQEGEEQFRALIENSSDVISILNGDGTIRYASPSVEQVLGYKPEELIGKGLLQFLHPDDVQKAHSTFEASVKNPGQPLSMEVRFLHKDGTWRVMEGVGNNRLDDPKLHGIVVSYRDITARRTAQRQLEMVEENYRTIFENSAVAITVANENEKIVYWNKFAEVLLGMDKDDLYMKPVSSLYPEDEWRKIRSQNVRRKGLQHHLETRIIKKNQQVIDVDLSLTVLKGPDGSVIGSIGIIADITARKTAQQQLRMVEDNYRTIFENSAVAITVADENEDIVSWNKFAEVLLGMDKDDLYMKPVSSLYPEAEWRKIRSQNVRQKGLQHHLETKIIRKNQQVTDVDLSLTVLKGPDGRVTGSIGIIADITARKTAQEQLEMVEENYRTIFENSAVAITVTDENEDIVSWNKFAEVLLGMDKDDLYMKPVSSLYPEAEWRKIRSQNVRQKGMQHHLETRIIKKNQEVIDVDLSLSVLKGPDGKVTGSIGIIADVTERKTAQQQLEMVEENYRTIFENSAVAITVTDENENIVAWNRFAEVLLGMGRDDLYMKPVSSLYPEAEWRKIRSQNVRQKGMQHHLETRIIRKNQEIIDVNLSLSVVKGPDGKVTGSIGVIADITERNRAQEALQKAHDELEIRVKQRTAELAKANQELRMEVTERKRVEEALQEKEEHFRALTENSLDAISILNGDGTIRYESPSVERILGYKREELIGRDVLDFLHPDDVHNVANTFDASIKNPGQAVNMEVRFLHKDGTWRVMEGIGSNRLGDPKVHGIVVNYRDITERKMAEEALRESEQRYRLLAENVTDVITSTDMNLKPIYVSPSIERLLGYSVEECMARTIEESLTPASREVALKSLARQLALEHGVRAESSSYPGTVLEFYRKDGSTVWVEVRTSFVRDSNGEPVGLVNLLRDVTDQKMAEEALRQSEQNYRALFESTIDGMVVIDAETMKVVLANQTAAKMYGFDSMEEVVEANLVDYIHPDDRDRALTTIAEDMFEKDMRQVSEFRTLTKDGREIWISGVGTRVEYQGRLAGLVSFRDITERKQMEEELRIKEDAVENSLGAVAMCDMEGKITYVNQACMRLWGWDKKGELLGKPYWEFLESDEAVEDVARAMIERQAWEGELVGRTRDGKEVHVEVFSAIVNDAHGNPVQTISSFTDITERKKAEEALRQSEERFRRLLEDMNDGYCVIQGFTVAFANARILEMFGYTPDEVVGRTLQELLPPEIVGELAQVHARRKRGESIPPEYETRLTAKDGSARPVEFGARTIEYAGKPAVSVVIRDITERKKAEEALRESEEKFRRLVEEMNDGYCVLQGSRLVFANARSAEMFGYTHDEVIGRTVQELLPLGIVDELSKVRAKRQLGDVVPQQYETTLASKDGRTRPVELGTRVIDYAGKPALSVVIRDISERKQAEEAVRRSEEQFRSLIENAQDAVVILNGDGTIRYESPSMERMTGRKAEDRIGKDPFEFAHPDDIPNVIEAFAQLLENQTTSAHAELRLHHEDGSWRTFEAVGSNLLDNPAVAGIVLNLHDITDRKQAEEEVHRLNEELEQRVIERTTQLQAVNKELEAFAYSVSHDLRAPLRSIDGFSQVLLEDYAGKLDEEGKDYLQRVRSGSQRMAELIDDILSLSRLTRSDMRLEMIDLSALAQGITMELQQSQPERQVEFIITPGLVAQGDAHLLRVALENLLGNAWKFTKERPLARIEFGYTKTNGQSAYFVRDNGVGFDMAYADKLFGAFQRLHPLNEFEGNGIGLATVQRIIHRHGGNIWAESAVDQGATFYFTL